MADSAVRATEPSPLPRVVGGKDHVRFGIKISVDTREMLEELRRAGGHGTFCGAISEAVRLAYTLRKAVLQGGEVSLTYYDQTGKVIGASGVTTPLLTVHKPGQ